jgi:hypothetical protein
MPFTNQIDVPPRAAGIPPKQVVPAVAVEVALAGNRGRAAHVAEPTRGDTCRPVHEPYGEIAAAVAPVGKGCITSAISQACRQQGKIDDRPKDDRSGVSSLQRVEDRAIPDVDTVGSREAQEYGGQDCCGQHPGQPTSSLKPEATCALPKSPQQKAALERIFRLIGWL